MRRSAASCFLSSRSHSSAALHLDTGRRRAPSVDPFDIRTLPLVGRPGGSVRRETATNSWISRSGVRLRALHETGIGGSYWNTFFPAVVVLGLGMAIVVAPLTTAVMESVPSREAGVASGVNNAVSRIAGLLAVAIFGLVLSAGFNRTLSRNLAQMQLSPSARQSVEIQRSKLAGAQISELPLKRVFDEAFVSGYRDVIWISVGLALLSALSAQMIQSKRSTVGVND